MVDDDQIRVRGATMHRGNKTPFELHAFLSGASLAPGVQLGPQLALIRQKGELRPVPSLRQAFPIANLREPIQFFDALQDRLAFHLVNFMPAKEIRAAFHHRHFQFRRKMLLHKGHILGEKLFLKRLRGRRNHHSSPAANSGDQIGQRLPGARSGFHKQMTLFMKSFLH